MSSIYGAILGWNYGNEGCKTLNPICSPIGEQKEGDKSRLLWSDDFEINEVFLLNRVKIISYIPIVSLIAAIFWREIPKVIATSEHVTCGERACFFVRYGISLIGAGSLFLIVDFIGYFAKKKIYKTESG